MLLATQVSEVARLVLRSSNRSLAGHEEAELSIFSRSERYLEALGPLRFGTVEEIPNVSKNFIYFSTRPEETYL